MNVYLVISYFDQAGGSEEALTTHAIELKMRGNHVVVFSLQSVPRENQYVKRLIANRVHTVAWPDIVVKLAADWYYQDRLVLGLSRATWPLLIPLVLATVFLRRQPVQLVWRGAVRRWQTMIGGVVHQDRLEQLLIAALNLYCIWKRPDVVHVFRPDAHAALGWAKNKGVAAIYYELSAPGEASFKYVSETTWAKFAGNLRKATLVTAVSKASADGLQAVTGINKPVHILMPVLSWVPESSCQSEACRPGPLTVTCVARLSAEKGLSDLLRAAKIVLAVRPDVCFLIAGGGPLLESLREEASRLGISEKVIFYGAFHKDQLSKIMSLTSIFALSSHVEGMPFTIVEAMAYGKPVVATRVGGVPEVVEHGKTGFVVPAEDPQRLAEALLLLLNDDQLRQQMGAAGRRKFETGSFTVEAYVAATLAAYEEAIALASSSHDLLQ